MDGVDYSNDGVCDDGGPGSKCECAYGSDCSDCGPRSPTTCGDGILEESVKMIQRIAWIAWLCLGDRGSGYLSGGPFARLRPVLVNDHRAEHRHTFNGAE